MCLLTVLVSVGYPRWESVEFGLHYYDYNNYSWILLLFKWAFFFILSFSYSLLLYFYLCRRVVERLIVWKKITKLRTLRACALIWPVHGVRGDEILNTNVGEKSLQYFM